MSKKYFVILQQEEIDRLDSEPQITVYRSIKSFSSNGKGQVALSSRDITNRTKYSQPCVLDIIQELLVKGAVKIVGTETRRGGTVNVYKVIVPLSVKSGKAITELSVNSKKVITPLSVESNESDNVRPESDNVRPISDNLAITSQPQNEAGKVSKVNKVIENNQTFLKQENSVGSQFPSNVKQDNPSRKSIDPEWAAVDALDQLPREEKKWSH